MAPVRQTSSQTLDRRGSDHDTSVRPGLGQGAEVRPPSRRSPARFCFSPFCPASPGTRSGGGKREKWLTPFEMVAYRPATSPTDRRPSNLPIPQRERWTMSSRLRAGARGLWALAFAIILGSSATAFAQTPGSGSITGKITEKGGKDPVGYANVVVLGTKQGAQTAEDGTF